MDEANKNVSYNDLSLKYICLSRWEGLLSNERLAPEDALTYGKIFSFLLICTNSSGILLYATTFRPDIAETAYIKMIMYSVPLIKPVANKDFFRY